MSRLFPNSSKKPTRDSRTGQTYPSRNQAGKAVAPELGLDPNDQYVWYAVCRRSPQRFQDVATGRPIDQNGRLAREGDSKEAMQNRIGRIEPPIVLRKGKPTAVILDIETYKEMLERLEDIEDLKTLERMRSKPLQFIKLEDFLRDQGPSV